MGWGLQKSHFRLIILMVLCIYTGLKVNASGANFCSFRGGGGGGEREREEIFNCNYLFVSFRWASVNFCDGP